MPTTTYGDTEARPVGVDPVSPEADRPDAPPPGAAVAPTDEIDTSWWEKALSDAERAEKNWRARGRDIVQIYRGDIPITRPKGGKYNSATSYSTRQDAASAFNILYANTEVMLPAAYSKPPDPVVKSRFIKKTADPIAPPPPPMMMPPGHQPAPKTVRLDLPEANRSQLVAAGLRETNIFPSGLCTACHTSLFFSYRKEAAQSGRLLGAIGLHR